MSRDKILSSIVSLSESMCRKAKELSTGSTNENSEEEESTSTNLIERGATLQKQLKKKKGKKSSGLQIRSKNDVQVSCCAMEWGRKQSFVRCSPLFEVDLKKSDSYDMVVEKVSSVVDIEEDEGETLVLLTSRGTIITSDSICLVGERAVDWTLGAYLCKRHVSADKITLGVAIAEDDSRAVKKPKLPTSSSKRSVNKHTYPKEADKDDEIKVYYSEKGNVVPKSREEVWEEIEGASGKMDKIGIFSPEDFDYNVVRIGLIKNGMSEIPVLKPNLKAKTAVCFHSPTLSQSYSIPLCVLCSAHPHCQYKWECLNKPKLEFPSTPVIFVIEPLLYKCTVKIKEGGIQESIHFDVSQNVIEVSEGGTTGTSDQGICSEHNNSIQTRPDRPVTIAMPIPSFHSLEFKYEELMTATDHFSKQNEIGRGGYGRVFIAKHLRCRGTTAAVKVLTKEGSNALCRYSHSNQITSELQALMKFRHCNILEIMGYCFSQKIKALVYKYMENGSLHTWIHDNTTPPLDWETRKTILMDMFRGVAYLHAGTPPMIHQDIKSHNVLIDDQYNAVVGDFGFAIESPKSVSGRTMITAPFIARTEGYFPPEILSGKVSPLCDVYSCGIVVLETFTALVAFSKDREDNDIASHTHDQRSDKQLLGRA